MKRPERQGPDGSQEAGPERGAGLLRFPATGQELTPTRRTPAGLSVCASQPTPAGATGPVARADPTLTHPELSEAPVHIHRAVNGVNCASQRSPGRNLNPRPTLKELDIADSADIAYAM